MLRPSNSSSEDVMNICSNSSVLTIVFSWMVFYLLLLPLFFSVLYIGFTQRKPSHSDVFTFHIVAMEILTTLGSIGYFFGGTYKHFPLQNTGSMFYCIGLSGQMFIHALTCAERYLAVVHPITYLRLRKRGGVVIRNVSIAVVWLLSVGSICLRFAPHMPGNYVLVCLFITSCGLVSVVGFCSVSVLCVLIRPGPGEGVGGQLRRIDQSKRRAFTTIVAIVSVLVLRFIFLIVTYFLSFLRVLNAHDSCMVSAAAGYVTFPSSLVLPLLFLQRAGKLQKSYAWCRSIRRFRVDFLSDCL